MQAMPEYHDNTTFIITCDHGRGSGPEQWKEHGVEEPGSENVWIAVMGPDTPAAGRADADRAGDAGADRGHACRRSSARTIPKQNQPRPPR